MICRIIRGRGAVSRRSKSASCELTMLSLSQAPRLGGLHRAARIPFRGSSFTAGLHPPAATPQGLIACLVQAMELQYISLIPSPRFVAHHPSSVRDVRVLGVWLAL